MFKLPALLAYVVWSPVPSSGNGSRQLDPMTQGDVILLGTFTAIFLSILVGIMFHPSIALWIARRKNSKKKDV